MKIENIRQNVTMDTELFSGIFAIDVYDYNLFDV